MGEHKIKNVDDILIALRDHPEDILGLEESSWLDFKESPYPLEVDKGKIDLAKDVSAFANADGGAIVLGVDTRSDVSLAIEIAETLKPFPNRIMDADRVQKIIHDYVYPRVDVRVLRFPVTGSDTAIWLIRVPKAKEIDYPCVVTKTILTPEGRPIQNFFSVYQRHEDRNAPFSPGQVWSWMNRAFSAPSPSSGRDNVAATSTTVGDDSLDDDRAAVRSDERESLFFLQFVPHPMRGEEIVNFYEGDPDSIQSALTKFQPIREHGFHFPVRRPPERTIDGSLRTTLQCHSSISVSRAGLVTVVASQSLFTWVSEKFAPPGEVWINPIAIVEFTLEACRFWKEVVHPRIGNGIGAEWRCGIDQTGGDHKLKLPKKPYSSRHVIAVPSSVASVGNDFLTDWTALGDGTAGVLAFAIVARVYREFGLGREFVPFSRNGAIDQNTIGEK